MGELNNDIIERQACDKSETGECLDIPNSTVRSTDLDNEKGRGRKLMHLICGAGDEW